MTEAPLVEWLSWAEKDNYLDPVQHLGADERARHRRAIAQSVVEHRVWGSVFKHQSPDYRYVPVVDGRWAYTFPWSEWGNFLASVWSIETGQMYSCPDFYLRAPPSPWGAPAEDGDNSEEGMNWLEAFSRDLRARVDAEAQRARALLLEGRDSSYGTLQRARPLLSPQEIVRALQVVGAESRPVQPPSPWDDNVYRAPPQHEPTEEDARATAAALKVYLRDAIAQLCAASFRDEDARLEHARDLFSVLLFQRALARPRRKVEALKEAPEREG